MLLLLHRFPGPVLSTRKRIGLRTHSVNTTDPVHTKWGGTNTCLSVENSVCWHNKAWRSESLSQGVSTVREGVSPFAIQGESSHLSTADLATGIWYLPCREWEEQLVIVMVPQQQFPRAGEFVQQTLQSVGSVWWFHGWYYCTSGAEWASCLASVLDPLD